MTAQVFRITYYDGAECKTVFFPESSLDILTFITRRLTARGIRYTLAYGRKCHTTCVTECGI